METQDRLPPQIVLPARLADVFRALKSGKHICRDDFADFRDVEKNEDLYRTLFAGLGYELIHHGQGFYYFKGGNQLSTLRLQAMALFVFILFQDLEDKKFQDAERMWERKLLTRSFNIAELPHFQTSQRRSLLFSLGVTPETLYEKVLKPMVRYGMLEMTGTDHFQFRSPIYRFIDLCLAMAEDPQKVEPSQELSSESNVIDARTPNEPIDDETGEDDLS